MPSAPADSPSTGLSHALARLGTLQLATTIVVGINALYITLVAFGNITDFDSNQPFVQHVLAMDTTNFGGKPGEGLDPDTIWRAIDAPPLQTAAYVGLIAWETLTALLLLWATGALLRARNGSAADLARARGLATLGLLALVLLFFGGFIVIGGEWFQMWKSTTWNGLDPAFRNSTLALFGLVLLHMPSGSSEHASAR
jgi:predicted small integral membrane protein